MKGKPQYGGEARVGGQGWWCLGPVEKEAQREGVSIRRKS